jgi:hypothetical protein
MTDKLIHRNDAKWKRAAAAWVEAEALYVAAKDKIIELARGECCYGAGVKHEKKLQAGKIAYKNVPQLEGVDLDAYRGKGFYKTTVSKI